MKHDFKLRPPARALACAFAVVVACLSGCASSPKVSAQWTDPTLGARSGLLRGATVFAVCGTVDVAVRQVCQQQLAAEVIARGSTPASVPSETPVQSDQPVDAQLLSAARTVDARAVLAITLDPATTDVSPGFSIGIGGFGFGRNSAGGVGVAAPIGGGTVRTGFTANGRVIDVRTGKLVWTASVTAAPASDLNAEVRSLTKAIFDAAQQSGLY